MDFARVQRFAADSKIDAWVIYDFRGGNPVLTQLLPKQRWTTRRVWLVIRLDKRPLLIVHHIDAPQFADCDVECAVFTGWRDMLALLKTSLAGAKRVAMEYSPNNELPAVSFADAGSVELIRSFGHEVVSSADLIQVALAVWSPEARREHARAAKITAQIKDEAFALIRDRIQSNSPVTELDVQRWILRRFEEEKLDPDHPPIVGCNANSGDPHFEVSPTSPLPIKRGDWVLIDLWARVPGEQHVFADISWVGFAGTDVPDAHRNAFAAVTGARDAAMKLAVDRWRAKKSVQGFELDDAARSVLIAAGFETAIRHRTGHSLSPGPKVHGLGANLDGFETRDSRLILPGTGFTIEPAVYPGTFGCRSEINVFVDETAGPVLTSPIQDDVLILV